MRAEDPNVFGNGAPARPDDRTGIAPSPPTLRGTALFLVTHAVLLASFLEPQQSAATAARLVISSSGVPRPASSPRRRMSVPPSMSTIASRPSDCTSLDYSLNSLAKKERML